MKCVKIGILGSGSASSVQRLLEAISRKEINACIRVAISDRIDSKMFDRMAPYKIKCRYVDCSSSKTRLDGAAEDECVKILKAEKCDLIILAGFLRIIKSRMLKAFPKRIINTHPSLLPSFPGIAAWHQAIEYGCKLAGVTIHFVDEGMDTGPIIIQKAIPIMEDDTDYTLLGRIMSQEQQAMLEAVYLFSQGRLRFDGRRVKIL